MSFFFPLPTLTIKQRFAKRPSLQQSKRNASWIAIPGSILRTLIDQLWIKRFVKKKRHTREQGSLKSQLTDYHTTKLKGNSKPCQCGCPQSLPRARCCHGDNILQGWGARHLPAFWAENKGMVGQLCTPSPSYLHEKASRGTGRSLQKK